MKNFQNMESQTLKFDFVFLGQSVLKYQVPLDIFTAINQIYEQNFQKLHKANKQLVGKISSSMNLSKADAERTFDGITEIILNCLKGDEQVKIAGFGTYKVAKRKARIGRNPRTGESIQIAASQKVKFLPAKALKEMFNK